MGETLVLGTGATAPRSRTCCAAAARPVTVALDGGELEVEVEDDLHVDLTGWAVPVFRGEIDLP